MISAALLMLRAVPVWAYAIALALAWGGFQHHRATAAGQRAMQAEKDLATLRADAAQTAINALAKNVATQQEAINAAQETAARDRADAATAGDAVQRLRQRLAQASASRCAAPAAATASAPAGAGADLCADVLGRVGEAAGRIAATADQRRTAGLACERIADQEVKP